MGSSRRLPHNGVVPDSSEIVYWSKGKIWRVDIDTKVSVNIPFEVVDERSAYPAVQVAVDVHLTRSRRQCLALPQKAQRAMPLFLSRWVSCIEKLLTGPRNAYTRSGDNREYSPAFSPDGKSVFFISWTDSALAQFAKSVLLAAVRRRVEHTRSLC